MASLANQIISYSIGVQQGENVLIECWSGAEELALCLVEGIRAVGGIPVLTIENASLRRAQLLGITEEGAKVMAALEMERIQKMQSFISLRAIPNNFEYRDVPPEKTGIYERAMKEVRNYRKRNTKWCSLKYPGPAMAQKFGMSTEGFFDFYFDAMLLDYKRMSALAEPLVDLVRRTDRVQVKAAGTDISFSIKGCKPEKPSFPNDTGNGRLNLPDGEIGCGVVKESVNGHIWYNTPTVYNDIPFSGIQLDAKEGKIINALCDDKRSCSALNAILDTDEGSRYFGEFSMGINPVIDRAAGDILFDEKMWGTMHFTPGHSPSAVHWDMVLSHRSEDGGGEIWFDGVLIRKDGYFVPEIFQPLNRENLMKEIRRR
jgi:aminopeptidase